MTAYSVVVDLADETTVEVQHVDMPGVEVGIPGGVGPKGEPGDVGPAGHGITVYQQATEPLGAVAGDIWQIP